MRKVITKKNVVEIVGKIMSVKERTIDIVILYRILKLVREVPNASLTELFKTYRERYGVKMNYNIIKRHIDYALGKGLIEKKGYRPSMIVITKKGIDYLYLLSQVENLLNEHMA